MIVTMAPKIPGLGIQATAAPAWTAKDTMALVVTGKGVVSSPAALAAADISAVKASLANEKAYTLAELQSLGLAERRFSARNSANDPFQILIKGIDLESIMSLSGFDPALSPTVTVDTLSYAKNGNVYNSPLTNYGDTPRYYYEDLAAGGAGAGVSVKPMLAYESVEIKNITEGGIDVAPSSVSLAAITAKDTPTLYVGQKDRSDQNKKLANKNVQYIQIGDAITENAITLFGKNYTRAQLMKMDRVTYTYTYQTKGGPKTANVRGVALTDLLALAPASLSLQDYNKVVFTSADNSTKEITVAQLKDEKNLYMLAYEAYNTVTGKWEPIYDNGKDSYANTFGSFCLYGGETATAGVFNQPAKMIKTIAKGTDASKFKHVTYIGDSTYGSYFAPDAITCATVTVEGPGLAGTTPVLMSELENTSDANIWQGAYTDTRSGTSVTRTYEGVKIKAIIDGLVNSNVDKNSDALKVVLKNRWRQDVATFSYSQLAEAATPVILAWGASDGTTTAPFVFNDSPILENTTYSALGINDGCLKLVYDKSDPKLSTILSPNAFSSVAYIYVENATGAPGYKHTEYTSSGGVNLGYNDPKNTQFLVTFTGSVLGREVNYTVEELEKMVSYNPDGTVSSGGIGFRKEYMLSNTTYWYLNEYEGVKLWDLMTTRMGVDADTYRNNETTYVSFGAWDHYATSAKFSMKQLANPNLFSYYEKSPLDSGTTRPTKAQLATEAYWPTSRIGADWVSDLNGYPVKKGYPVVLAYGVNGYPYVTSSNQDGYTGGLGNDGGPVRVIFGKTDNMIPSNPDNIQNYAYFYNNGSNQLQRVQEIFVGDDTRYSTHTENPAYQSMATGAALTVEVYQDGVVTPETKTFTLKQLEDLLYADSVTGVDRGNRQEKAYYYYKIAKGNPVQDLFEGVNLNYLLTEAVGLQGTLGTVSFYSAGAQIGDPIALSAIDDTGYNSINGMSGLESMVAFAKNGYPMVSSTNEADGYVTTDLVTKKTIKNNGGPLMLLTPQTAEEKAAGTLGALANVSNLNKIVIHLGADSFAHTGATYGSYGTQTLDFTGGVTNEKVTLSVNDIEKAQKFMVTDSYSVAGSSKTYRGIDLKSYLFSPAVGASALLSEVTVKNAAGDTYTLTADNLTNPSSGKKVILAYGTSDGGAEGRPLVPGTGSGGYEAGFLNTGGPLRLIFNGGTDTQCIKNVTEISVAVADVDGWTHSFGVYQNYANQPGLRLSGSDISATTDFTVEELEKLSAAYQVFDEYKVGNNVWVQGIDLWKLINNYVGVKAGSTFTSITANASDGYGTTFTRTQLTDGVNGKPILVAYGMGTTSENGLPLVGGNDTTNIQNGFSTTAGNAFGPLRIIVHDNTGWCAKWLDNVVVGTGTHESPVAKSDIFTITGNNLATGKTFSETALAALGEKTVSYPYTAGGVLSNDSAVGVDLADVLEAAGAYGDQYTYNIKTTDNTTNSAYLNITKGAIEAQNYLLAYKANGSDILDTDKAGAEAAFRIYRNQDAGTTWKNRLTCVTGIEAVDKFSNSVVFTLEVDGGETQEFTRSELAAMNSTPDTETFGAETVTGIKLADFFSGLGLTNTGSSITVNTKAGAVPTLTNVPLSTAGNYFLAWKAGDDFIGDVVGGQTCALRIYTGSEVVQGITGVKTVPVYNWIYNQLGAVAPASVRCVTPDTAGGYWIGTTVGLYYYKDGTVTQPYTTANGKLLRDYVIDVELDGSGGIYVTQGWTYSGAQINYGLLHIDSAGNATNYTNANTGGALPHDYVQALELDKDGNLWIGSFGGLTKFDVDTNTWKTFTKADGLPALSVNVLTQDGTGGLWIGCYPNGSNGGLAAPFTGGYAYLSKEGALKAWNYDAAKDTDLKAYLLGDFWVRGIAVDANGGAWITRSGAAPSYFANIDISECVGGRLDYVSPDKSTVTHYTGRELIPAINQGIIAPDPANAVAGATPELRAVAVDGKGGLWLGTSGLGIFHIKTPGTVESQYSSGRFDWKSTLKDNVYALGIAADGTILSGSNGGFATQRFTALGSLPGLVSLRTGTGTLNPSFDPDTNSYLLAVPAGTTQVKFSTTPLSLGSVIEYNDSLNSTVSCPGNVTEVIIKVSANGQDESYCVTIVKQQTAATGTTVDGTDKTLPLAVLATGNNVTLSTDHTAVGGNVVANLPALAETTQGTSNSPSLYIEEKTKATGSAAWNGTFLLPSIEATGSVTVKNAKMVNSVVAFGSKTESLTFDTPVRIYLPGMGGKALGFIPAGSTTMTAISYEMEKDSSDSLPALQNAGSILVDNVNAAVWLRQSGTVVAYTQGTSTGEQVPVEYALVIDGDGVKSEKGYTLTQLLNWSGKFTGYYSWLNNYGTKGGESHTGIKLSELLEASGLADRAVSITLKADDFVREFNLGTGELGVDKTYLNNLYMILEVKSNGNIQLVVPQETKESINKQHWINGIETITVNVTKVTPGGGTPGAGVKETPVEEKEQETGVTETVKAAVTTTTTVSNGTASATLDSANTKKALESIKAGAPTDGSKAKGMLEIDAKSKDKESVKTAEVKLPKASVDAVAGEKNVSTTIKTDLGDIVIDPDVMAALSGASGSDVTISITKTEPADLDEATRKAIGDRPVLDITVTVDGKKMSTFGGSRIRSDVPYTAASGENNNMILMFYLDGKDAGKPVKLSLFDGKQSAVKMGTTHLSLYGVGYNNVTFSDISSHWAKNSIEFLAAREILKGKSASTFDPEGKVTRAEYVTMLANSIDGIEPAKAAAAGFEDISSSAWYAAYVNWAVSESIVKGYADGTFRPEEKITREQMAAMTESFLKAMELDVDVVNKKIEFKDQNKISSWSAGAVTSMQQRGIINGNPDGSFAPQGTATRAQAAAILKAYMEALLK